MRSLQADVCAADVCSSDVLWSSGSLGCVVGAFSITVLPPGCIDFCKLKYLN